jgi:hypothetical protein
MGLVFSSMTNTTRRAKEQSAKYCYSKACYSKMRLQGLWALFFFFFLIRNDFQKQTKSENKKQKGDSIGKNIVCIIIKALLFLLSSRLLFSSSRFMTLPVTGIWSLLGPISPVAFLPYRTMLIPSAFAP